MRMNRFYRYLAIAFFVLAPPWGCYIVFRDFSHPETWDRWQKNPNVYLPMWGVVALCGVALAIFIYLSERRPR